MSIWRTRCIIRFIRWVIFEDVRKFFSSGPKICYLPPNSYLMNTGFLLNHYSSPPPLHQKMYTPSSFFLMQTICIISAMLDTWLKKNPSFLLIYCSHPPPPGRSMYAHNTFVLILNVLMIYVRSAWYLQCYQIEVISYIIHIYCSAPPPHRKICVRP